MDFPMSWIVFALASPLVVGVVSRLVRRKVGKTLVGALVGAVAAAALWAAIGTPLMGIRYAALCAAPNAVLFLVIDLIQLPLTTGAGGD